ATGEHGDLLDVIRESRGLSHFSEVAAEAEMFLRLPPISREAEAPHGGKQCSSRDTVTSARRLFAAAQSIPGTIVEKYLRNRGITALHETGSLRFHPRCYYRPDPREPIQPLPAMIAAVTDLRGRITGIHRTWLAPDGSDKASIATPRRAMGHLLEHAVRFGRPDDVLAASEGIETTLSVRTALPNLPMAAALSAAHLAVIAFPPGLRRLYIVRDNDPAGVTARDSLTARANSARVEAIVLSPTLGDFNEDLRAFGVDALRARLRCHLAPEDVSRFMALSP
ncbi:toprim domain-containing protein, partial [Xanthobacter autotrophicus]